MKGTTLGRRPTKIKVEVIWETTDNPNAMLPWVRATEILLRAKERHELYLARLEKENPALHLVENLVGFARRQEDVFFYTHRRVPFRVEVPLDMARKNKGLLYIREASGRTHTEPLSALTEIAAHYLLTLSLDPSAYFEITRNATFTLALLSQFLAQPVQNQSDAPPEHDNDAPHSAYSNMGHL